MNFPKYIITKHDFPYLFSNDVTHADMARVLGFTELDTIVGAGFFCIRANGTYKCWGESISLKVQSRKETDAQILNRVMGGVEL